jgi:hypothetical protein
VLFRFVPREHPPSHLGYGHHVGALHIWREFGTAVKYFARNFTAPIHPSSGRCFRSFRSTFNNFEKPEKTLIHQTVQDLHEEKSIRLLYVEAIKMPSGVSLFSNTFWSFSISKENMTTL